MVKCLLIKCVNKNLHNKPFKKIKTALEDCSVHRAFAIQVPRTQIEAEFIGTSLQS